MSEINMNRRSALMAGLAAIVAFVWPWSRNARGAVTYDGIQKILDCSYTNQAGITPSAAVVEFARQESPPDAQGTLTFWEDGKPILELPDCKVDTCSAQGTARILDRRWQWKFGNISGTYNTVGTPQKTLQDLAALCLEAMGEKNYDATALPNARFHVIWDNAIPAQALADLAERVGCRVVLGADNTVKIVVDENAILRAWNKYIAYRPGMTKP